MRRSAVAAVAIAATLLAAGCGGGGRAITIGVLSDCVGFSSGLNETALGAVALPLLERGARLAGRKPSDGVEHAKVAGRRVDVVAGCTESGNFARLIEVARRLIEQQHADVVIGPIGEGDGLVLRDVARRHPEVSVVLTLSDAQESTLHDPAPNVFRFFPDGAQLAAGLGAYAYNVLGWRTAAVAGTDYVGWPQGAGFIAEFCALGGRVVERRWFPLFVPWDVKAAIFDRADGVAFFPFFADDWLRIAKAYAARHPDLARRVVLGLGTFGGTPQALSDDGRTLAGAVTASSVPFVSTPEWTRLKREVARRLPGLPPLGQPDLAFLSYYNAMEATAQALERAGGDLSRFSGALSTLVLRSPTGPIRLDANHQAVARGYLARVALDARGKAALRPLRTLSGVEQTFNGYFTRSTPGPSRTSPACRPATPPAWARP